MADVLPSFDQLTDDSAINDAQAPAHDSVPPFDQLQDDSHQFETPGQQLKAGAEGLAKGVLGPLAPYLEKKVLHVAGTDIRAREAANPITHDIGQGIGLVGGALTGTGEGAVMTKAGELAAEAAGLAAPVSFAAKVGSSAVQQAAEMAVLQGSDETSKMILNDPETSAQSAIANIGLATALGGAGGTFITGAVSPLWKATAGNKVEKFLGGLKDHLDGTSRLIMPEAIENSAKTLGIELSPELRAGLSGDPKAAMMFNELREIQHPTITAGLQNLERDTNDAVLRSIGRSPEEIANYSEAEGGKHAMESFKKEYQAKYEPIAKEFDELTKPFESTPINLFHQGSLADKVSNMAAEKGYIGTDIPQNKVVNAVLDRVSNIKNANDFAKLNTTINNMTKGDFTLTQVGRDLKTIISDAHHNALEEVIGKEAPQLMARYRSVRGAYADLAKVSNEIGSELGLGKFIGPKSLLAKLAEKRSPEQFLSRLSPKGNAEILDILGKHFPQTLESIRDNELKQILKPAVLGAKGDQALNSRILNNAIERGLAGQPERIKFAMPPGALEKIQAAKTLMDAIPGMKSSGTAGWQQKMMAYVPQSAMAGVSMLMGHNPVFGYLGGHVGKLLARDMPDAIKLGLLRFMSSDQPIKAEGFKSMVEFLHNSIKGQTFLNKAAGNVFKSGSQILTDNQMPSKADREKLNKIIEKTQDKPEVMMKLTNGQTGHYLPGHQASLTQASAQAIQYLQQLKPKPYQPGPLDKPIEPRPDQVARYNRALDIANQPAIVLQHIKDGTLQTTDLVDLKSMYPAVYSDTAKKMSNSIIDRHSEDHQIPYKTRMGVSLFLGQPIDSSMNPMSIQSAQPQPKPMPPQQNQSNPKGTSAQKLGKTNKSYMTRDQSREYDRSNKD